MLSSHSQKWLKIAHVYLGGIWSGGAASLFAIHCIYFPNSGPEFFARNIALIFVDYYIIIPAAVGSVITGLLYSQLTHWGYIKHTWIIVKWLLTLLFVGIGFFWLVPWLHDIKEISDSLRHAPAIDANAYEASISMHLIMTLPQTVMLFFLVILSVLKPWGKTRYKW